MRTVFHFEFAKGTSPKTEGKELTFADIREMLKTPGTEKAERSYLPGTIKDHHRKRENIISRSAVTLDLDGAQMGGFEALSGYLSGKQYFWHTTFSHSPEKPSFRFIIPLAEDISPELYESLVSQIITANTKASIDTASCSPAQIMFTPACADKDNYIWGESTGELADAKVWVEEANGGEAVVPLARVQRRGNPEEVPGIIGRFNKAFPTLDELVEVFGLPYVYVPEVGRYRYAGSSIHSTPGMSEIEENPGYFYSWHAKDPASGYAQNSFDLLRIHKFGELDEGYSGPPVHAPSYKAAKDFIETHEAFKQRESEDAYAAVLSRYEGAIVAETPASTSRVASGANLFALPEDEPEVPTAPSEEEIRDKSAWVKLLTVDKKTQQVENTVDNLELIFQNDPFLNGLGWCERGGYEAWTKDGYNFANGAPHQLNNRDISIIQFHIEKIYGMRSITRTRVEQMLEVLVETNRYDPVQDYLNSLEWDGVPRLNTCIPGVESTEYNEMVARKALIGAVARALKPGVKADQSLILAGEAGLGKSWWVERMSRGFSSVLGPIDRKDTLISASRGWIITSDEGHALSKAEFNQLKEFMTLTQDTYRPPYERAAQTVKRRWVIWGTTNDPKMLREREGNRRFLIVDIREKADFDKYTDEYVDQVWAEAVHAFKSGESHMLSEAEEALAESVRTLHTQTDDLADMISEGVDVLLPGDWDTKTVSQRTSYMLQVEQGMAGGSVERETISPVEVWTEIMARPRADFDNMNQRRIYDALVALSRRGVLRRPLKKTYKAPYGTVDNFEIIRFE